MMKLSKRVPARTKTLVAKWCKQEFMVMDQTFRDVRAKMGHSKMDRCHWCHHYFEDGEMMALACFETGGNKMLCQKCATELKATEGD